MKKMTFVQAMKDFFGLRESTTNLEFMREMRDLTDSDKDWFRTNLPKVGYELITV